MSKPENMHLDLQNVSVHYGKTAAVCEASLSLQAGKIGCLLGPSGCGKTTLLRAIAGFEPLSDGEISLNDEVLSTKRLTKPPEHRRVGMVFQDFALFPHLNVADNIGFGLPKLKPAEHQTRIQAMLDLVGLPSSGKAYPHELSGGQQQRIALARALAPKPELLLLDEPFSGLDAELREALAAEIRTLLKATGVTALLVTHDQCEAFAMADHITLMQAGRVVQSATPQDLYHAPASVFAGEFIGEGVIIESSDTLFKALNIEAPAQQNSGEVAKILIRPEAVNYAGERSHNASQHTVHSRVFRGAQYLYQLELSAVASDRARPYLIPCLTPTDVKISVGDTMQIKIDPEKLIFLTDG